MNSASFKFAQMTDTHLYSGAPAAGRALRNAFMRAAIAECAGDGVDFIVHTGDFCSAPEGRSGLEEFKQVCDEAAARHGIGFRYVRGNHDWQIGDAAYAEVFGPETYWFQHKGWAFIGIDCYHKTYEHTQHAYCMSAETLDKIADIVREIPPGMPMVAMLHNDPVGISRFHRGLEMLRLLQRGNLRLLLFGHVQSSYVGGFDNIPFVTVSGEDCAHDSSPLSRNIVTCQSDQQCACRFVPYSVNLDAVPAPHPLRRASKPARISVSPDWATLRGPTEARRADGELPSHAPVLAWEHALPGPIGAGGLTLKDGLLYAGTTSKGGFAEGGIHAFDAATGKAVWSLPTDAGVDGGLCLADGAGFAATTAGSLYRVNPRDGGIVWRWNNRDNMPIACQPVFHDGLVHCGANWEMYAVDACTGATVWRKIATPDGFTYMGPGHASPLIVGDRVYHQRPFNARAQGQGLVQSVRQDDGKDLRITRELPVMHPLYRHASPVLWEGKVLAAGLGLLVIEGDRLDTPAMTIQHDSPASATPAVSAQGVAYVSYHREIVAHDLTRGGDVLWRVPHEPALLHFSGNPASKWGGGEKPYGAFAAPLLIGDKLVVCDTGGSIRCLTAADGTELWRLSLGVPIVGAPVASGNALFVGDYGGRLLAFAW